MISHNQSCDRLRDEFGHNLVTDPGPLTSLRQRDLGQYLIGPRHERIRGHGSEKGALHLMKKP